MNACGKGRAISLEQAGKMAQLLRETDMTIEEIARRFQCSKSAVLSVNRKRGVRFYRGHVQWTVNAGPVV